MTIGKNNQKERWWYYRRDATEEKIRKIIQELFDGAVWPLPLTMLHVEIEADPDAKSDEEGRQVWHCEIRARGTNKRS